MTDTSSATQRKSHLCSTCHKNFSCPQSLSRHLYTKHRRESCCFCKVCRKGFTRRDVLQKHIQNLHGLDPHYGNLIHTGTSPPAEPIPHNELRQMACLYNRRFVTGRNPKNPPSSWSEVSLEGQRSLGMNGRIGKSAPSSQTENGRNLGMSGVTAESNVHTERKRRIRRTASLTSVVQSQGLVDTLSSAPLEFGQMLEHSQTPDENIMSVAFGFGFTKDDLQEALDQAKKTKNGSKEKHESADLRASSRPDLSAPVTTTGEGSLTSEKPQLLLEVPVSCDQKLQHCPKAPPDIQTPAERSPRPSSAERSDLDPAGNLSVSTGGDSNGKCSDLPDASSQNCKSESSENRSRCVTASFQAGLDVRWNHASSAGTEGGSEPLADLEVASSRRKAWNKRKRTQPVKLMDGFSSGSNPPLACRGDCFEDCQAFVNGDGQSTHDEPVRNGEGEIPTSYHCALPNPMKSLKSGFMLSGSSSPCRISPRDLTSNAENRESRGNTHLDKSENQENKCLKLRETLSESVVGHGSTDELKHKLPHNSLTAPDDDSAIRNKSGEPLSKSPKDSRNGEVVDVARGNFLSRRRKRCREVLSPKCSPRRSRKGRHVCSVCNKSFAYQDSLKRHAKSHDLPLFRCSVCFKEMHRLDLFTKHLAVHQKRGKRRASVTIDCLLDKSSSQSQSSDFPGVTQGNGDLKRKSRRPKKREEEACRERSAIVSKVSHSLLGRGENSELNARDSSRKQYPTTSQSDLTNSILLRVLQEEIKQSDGDGPSKETVSVLKSELGQSQRCRVYQEASASASRRDGESTLSECQVRQELQLNDCVGAEDLSSMDQTGTSQHIAKHSAENSSMVYGMIPDLVPMEGVHAAKSNSSQDDRSKMQSQAEGRVRMTLSNIIEYVITKAIPNTTSSDPGVVPILSDPMEKFNHDADHLAKSFPKSSPKFSSSDGKNSEEKRELHLQNGGRLIDGCTLGSSLDPNKDVDLELSIPKAEMRSREDRDRARWSSGTTQKRRRTSSVESEECQNSQTGMSSCTVKLENVRSFLSVPLNLSPKKDAPSSSKDLACNGISEDDQKHSAFKFAGESDIVNFHPSGSSNNADSPYFTSPQEKNSKLRTKRPRFCKTGSTVNNRAKSKIPETGREQDSNGDFEAGPSFQRDTSAIDKHGIPLGVDFSSAAEDGLGAPTNKPRSVGGQGDVACPDCGKTFRERRVMLRHMKSHGPPEHLCHLCMRAFHRKDALKKHIHRHKKR